MKNIAVGIIAGWMVIQFLPIGMNHTNPPLLAHPKWDNLNTKQLFNRACADCHSHETQWPWYSNIAPVSWIIEHHVKEGREHFNVSTWGLQSHNEGDEASQELKEGKMPIAGYTLMHPEAQLTTHEKRLLIEGLEKTFGTKKVH